jgi:signal transduction histidine kinase
MSALTTAAMPSANADSAVLRRAIGALMWVVVGINVLFIVGLIATQGGNNQFVNVGLALAGQWVPVTIFWLVVARNGFTRVPVILAAAGVTFSALGDTYYSLSVDADGYLPFPSPADIGYLLFYPLMIAAIAVLTGRRLAGAGRLVVLETVVATVGASAVLAVVLGPLIAGAMESGTVLESAIALAYPLFDLILIAAIAGVASVPTVRVGRRWWALVTGLAIFAAADVVYAVLEADDAYVVGTPLDATWTIGLAFITWWVAGVSHASTSYVHPAQRRMPLSLPAIAVLAGLAVLVVGTAVEVSVLAVVLAALTVGLGAVPIVFRQAMLGRMLAAQEEAVRRLTELDHQKTDLLVTVNHEFRTPLTSINGHVELLLDGTFSDLPPAATEALRTIERNGAKLQSLIDDTFTASRLQAAEDVLERCHVEVAGLVARAAARVEAQAARNGMTLTVDCDTADLEVDADGPHLERALANLIDNAVKFSEPGSEVAVTASGSVADGEVVVRVTDTGMGIPAGDVSRLFTKFFRASNVQRAAIPGVGLGLSISQQIVQAHGGTIAIDSSLGHGTTLTVRLPIAQVERVR